MNFLFLVFEIIYINMTWGHTDLRGERSSHRQGQDAKLMVWVTRPPKHRSVSLARSNNGEQHNFSGNGHSYVFCSCYYPSY